MTILVPLSIPQTITIYRQRYPGGLICVACGRLLATRRESYAKSNLTEAERLAFVCAECRLEGAEKERIALGRPEQLAAARAVAAQNRATRVIGQLSLDSHSRPSPGPEKSDT